MSRDLLKGMQILDTYMDDDYFVPAEHDIIYFNETTRPVSEEDFNLLIEYGFFQDDVDVAGDEAVYSEYDPEASWSKYV